MEVEDLFGISLEFKSSRPDEEISQATQDFAGWCGAQQGFHGVTFWHDEKGTYGAIVQFGDRGAAETAQGNLPNIDVAETTPVIRIVETFNVLAGAK